MMWIAIVLLGIIIWEMDRILIAIERLIEIKSQPSLPTVISTKTDENGQYKPVKPEEEPEPTDEHMGEM